jgi:hypothetical protein
MEFEGSFTVFKTAVKTDGSVPKIMKKVKHGGCRKLIN